MPSSADLPARAQRVFINCPFDQEYQSTFDAIIFTIVCCGFTPCSALESETVADVRIDRILDGLTSAKYSLHDLSRYRGEGDESLARFNMPLELGAALALRHLSEREYDWAALVPEGHLYARFVSDLAGYDLLRYDGSPDAVVPKVMRWLISREDAIAADVTPVDVLTALPQFRQRKEKLEEAWAGEPPWGHLLAAAVAVAGTL